MEVVFLRGSEIESGVNLNGERPADGFLETTEGNVGLTFARERSR